MILRPSFRHNWIAWKSWEPYVVERRRHDISKMTNTSTILADSIGVGVSGCQALTTIDVFLVRPCDLALVLVCHGLGRERRAVHVAGRVHRLLQRISFPSEEIITVAAIARSKELVSKT